MGTLHCLRDYSRIAAVFVLALFVARASALAAQVVFDLPSAVECRDVTSSEFAQVHPTLKVIEAKKFLVAVTGGERRNSTVDDAHHVAEVIAAAAASSERGTWQQVPAVPAATFGGEPATTATASG